VFSRCMRKVSGMVVGMRLYPCGRDWPQWHGQVWQDNFVQFSAFSLHKSFGLVLFWENGRETSVWGMAKTPVIA